MFINSGLNKFFHYMPMPKDMPEEMMKDFGALMEISWLLPLIAVAEIAIISIYFIMPLYPSAVPFSKDFSWTSMNYAPLVTGGALILLWIWWHLSVKKWFKGPIKNV